MAVTYVRDPQTNEFKLVGPGGATTDTTLSQSGFPADAAAVGSALSGKSDSGHSHAIATSSASGLMSATDKTYIDNLTYKYIGSIQDKTIPDLQAYLETWISEVYDVPNATLVIKSTDFISLWNNGDTTTTVSNGPSWTFTLKTYFSSANYALLELCSYYDKKVYYVVLSNGEWGAIRQVAFNINATTSAAGLMSAADKAKLNSIEEGAKNNLFGSLTELGITSFPTTMKAVASAMPANSMIVIDTRRVNGSGTDYDTEPISDWNNTTNGMALIMKDATTNNTVSWTSSSNFIDEKVDKIIKKSATNLNTLTTPGFYYVSANEDTATSLNFPIGVNGHLLVMSDGSNRVRQVFMRLGTADTNCFQWYSRTLHTDSWSKWWLISGQEKIWNGGAVNGDEINIGSRYGCQSWIVVARLQNTGAMTSIVIPRAFLTNDTDLHKFQIADETCFISFFIYYKSDNNVYLKVVDQSDNEYTTLKYVYRTT